jgi:DNA-binding LytR/AlgR family response regulator
MDQARVLVVEDEIIIAENICDTLREIGYNALEPVMNYTEAIEAINNNKPDIAILDVQLSGEKSGIDLGEVIKQKYGFPFLFLTSNSDLATLKEAKKVTPSAYLVKPFSKQELYNAIEVALYNFSQNKEDSIDKDKLIKDALFLKVKGVYQKILLDDILYVKSEHVYLEIFLKDKSTILIRASFTDILERLTKNFIRTHRSYIVNTSYISQIENGFLRINDKALPVGKKYRQLILDQINYI